MSKEKQIEEMAKEFAKIQCNKKGCEDCEFYQFECDDLEYYTKIAEHLYNAGYRKQSEGAWKGNGSLKNCSECGNVVNFNNVSIWLYNYCPNCGAKMKGGAE